MKFVVVPNNIEEIEKYKKAADAFIFGLINYSVNYNINLSVEEIENIVSLYPDKEIFIAINKNIFNHELNALEEILCKLSKIKIKAVLFYDLAILNLKIKNNLDLDLVWNQTHMVTNYNTCNYYYDKGVNYAYLAGEITLEEMLEIINKSKIKTMALLVGYPVMAHSRRKLLNNYFKSIKKEKIDNKYVITNNDERYIIKEENAGDTILFGKIVNGVDTIIKLSDCLDYAVFIEDGIFEDVFYEVILLLKEYVDSHSEETLAKIYELLGNYTGFFFNKTIYKVKKDEK